MKAFTDKGRLSQLLINMPVRIILEPRAALLGAAAYAEASAAELSGASRGPRRSWPEALIRARGLAAGRQVGLRRNETL